MQIKLSLFSQTNFFCHEIKPLSLIITFLSSQEETIDVFNGRISHEHVNVLSPAH